jgi:putative membrane protein
VTPAADGTWQRLHPLSPVLRAGRVVVPVLVLTAQATAQGGNGRLRLLVSAGVTVLGVVAGVVSWLVTRWRIEDRTLRIETGLLRRDSRRVPLSRIQAVDIVRPLLGRLLGLSELRLRLAGAHHGDARLSYLGEEEAAALRARLLALAHGLAEQTPPPPEVPLLLVPTPRLIASLLLSDLGVTAAVLLVLAPALVAASPAAAGTLLAPAVGFVVTAWRRLNGEFEFSLAEAPDGLRLRAGLLETRAETIPYGRVQALRLVEPLLWRWRRWCRLEVDVAGQGHVRRGDEQGVRMTRTLLPVGSPEQATGLIARILPAPLPPLVRPPRRVRLKSPLGYRFLAAGVDAQSAATQTGRVRRALDVVPLSKVQSVRWVQGPVQRWLGLATVHLDTAGRNVHAVLRDRDAGEAQRLMEQLPALCREARRRDAPRLAVSPASPGG